MNPYRMIAIAVFLPCLISNAICEEDYHATYTVTGYAEPYKISFVTDQAGYAMDMDSTSYYPDYSMSSIVIGQWDGYSGGFRQYGIIQVLNHKKSKDTSIQAQNKSTVEWLGKKGIIVTSISPKSINGNDGLIFHGIAEVMLYESEERYRYNTTGFEFMPEPKTQVFLYWTDERWLNDEGYLLAGDVPDTIKVVKY